MLIKPDKADFERIPESSWRIMEITEDYVRSYADVTVEGAPMRVERTQYLADQMLQDANRHEYAESEGKRWGGGRVVARVPLNYLFKHLARHMREGDRDHMKWWLNREENLPFRTFKGKL